MNQTCLVSLLLFVLSTGQAIGKEERGAFDVLSATPMVSSDAWALAEVGSGDIVCASRPHQVKEIASLVKIMNAQVVLDVAEVTDGYLDRTVAVSARAASMIGTSAKLRAGDRLTIRELLYGMLLPSGNDAAVALAEYAGRHLDHYPGDGNLSRFIAAMNHKAERMGMGNTRFVDVHGMGSSISTPVDILKLSREALRNQRFRDIVATREIEISIYSNRGELRQTTWLNTNELLDRFSGVKTGHTNSAGGALVLLAEQDGAEYLVAVLGSSNQHTRFSDAFNLFHWFIHRKALGSIPVVCTDS